jgi:hypothetical protein
MAFRTFGAKRALARHGSVVPRVRKLLGSSSKKAGPPVRRVKIGSVIVREHQGKLHEVLESANGVSR